MPSLLSILLSRTGLTAIAVVLLLTAVGVQSARLSHAKEDLGRARAALVDPATGRTWKALAITRERDLTACVLDRTSLKGALQRQNAAVGALAAEGDRMRRVSAQAAQAAALDAARARRAAADILARRPGADVCQDALALIREPAP